MSNPSRDYDLAPCHRLPVAIVVVLALATATLVGAAAVADGATARPAEGTSPGANASVQENGSELDVEPDDGRYVVELHPREPGEVRIEVEFEYESRSPAEWRRAENETLAADWFRGEEIVADALQSRDVGEPTTEHSSRSVGTSEIDGDRRINVGYRTTWTGFMEPDRERAVLGPAFASALSPDDQLRVRLDHPDWGNWTVNRDEHYTAGEASTTYAWTIGEDPEPRVVLRREDADGVGGSPLGPSVQFLLPAVALLAVAAGYLAKRRR